MNFTPVDDCARALHGVALHNGSVVTEDHNANVIRLQIQRHPFQTGREFNHFTSLDGLETVDARNAIRDGQNTPNLLHTLVLCEVGDPLRQDLRELRRAHLGQGRRGHMECARERRKSRASPDGTGQRPGAKHGSALPPLLGL